ncbi:MAG TPA: uroporphyrinogen decarboxylase [Polyangiaceae bacterium]|nr:uroporphyrinogen decarboxylase [Polyangiaceae bacterium]HMR76394.1 uroporphyrinogen decarboxylase [Polyangiaceae bacterium]
MWDRFLRACRREPVDTTPVWFMRQAGRYMPEYRAIRKKHTLLEICRIPDIATEVTLQPVRAMPVDAAILFADILLPLEPMGAAFEFAAGEGPVFESPLRKRADIEALRVIEPREDLSHVLQAIRQIRAELDGKTPLIGFAGAPFTLASYLIEGGKSSNYAIAKTMMYSDTALWNELLDKLARVVREYLVAQVEAGAQALQLFDSWIGALGPGDYAQYVQPHVKTVLDGVKDLGVPVIHFGTGTATLLELQKQAGGSVIGIDWRVPLDQAQARLGNDVALQGNLDPILMYAERSVLEARVVEVLEKGKQAPGHIFNLGHGILPDMSPDTVRWVAELVHERGKR